MSSFPKTVQTVFAIHCLCSLVLAPISASAQDASQNLAKELANPIASLISVPIQVNYDRNIGPVDDGIRVTTNVQPVVPFQLNENWTLISRTIVPIIYQDDIFPATRGFDETTIEAGALQLETNETVLIPGAGSQFGLGDVVQSLFFSPSPLPLSGGGSFIFGAGPVLLIPLGTDDLLTTDKWGAGPTAVGLVQSGPWTVGALTNHIWSYAGNSSRDDVNATFIQPFISYTTPDAVTFTLQTETTYDWENDQWSVPINFVVSKLTRFGSQPVSLSAGVRYWAESAPGGPEDLGFRLATTFLFPTK